MSFRPIPDHELDQLSDEKLIAYIRDASRAGNAGATTRGLAILIYGYARDVERRMALRVPRYAVEEAAHDALVRALASTFDGSSRGEFRAWLNTIVDRTAADWYRRRDRRPSETPLPSEHIGDDDAWGDEPSEAAAANAVELAIVVEEVMSQLSDAHRQVVELHVFAGLPAAGVCDRVDGMTRDNVAQVASRFRKRLHEALSTSSQESTT